MLLERQWTSGPAVVLGAAAVCSIGWLSLSNGPVQVPHTEIWDILLGLMSGDAADSANATIVKAIRAPRLLLGCALGVAMSTGGVALQGVFRNRLADPSLIGVTGGALLGAALAVVIGGGLDMSAALRPWLMSLSAFVGALLTTLAVKSVSVGISRAGLILAGIAVNALVASISGFLFLLSDDAQLRALTMWSMGGLGGAGWTPALVAAGATVFSTIVLWRSRDAFDLLLLGESSAEATGLSLRELQWKTMIAVAIGVGAVTSATGLVGFIGLIVPHILRLLLGPRHGKLLLGSLFAGPILVLGADLFARLAAAPIEIPLGVVMSGIGGPALLLLLMRKVS